MEYFCVQKIESNSGWYEAIKRDNWCPTTTNWIERHNKLVKEDHTFRERWSLGRFCSKTLQITESWSFDRNFVENPNAKKFHSIPEIPFKLFFFFIRFEFRIWIYIARENVENASEDDFKNELENFWWFDRVGKYYCRSTCISWL